MKIHSIDIVEYPPLGLVGGRLLQQMDLELCLYRHVQESGSHKSLPKNSGIFVQWAAWY